MRIRFRAAAVGAAVATGLFLAPVTASAQDFEPEPGASTYWWVEHPAQLSQNFSSDPLGVGFAMSMTPVLPFIPFLDSTGTLFETMYGSSGIPVLRDLSPIG